MIVKTLKNPHKLRWTFELVASKKHLFYTLSMVGSLELLILFAQAPFSVIMLLEVKPKPTALEERVQLESNS